MDGTQAAPDTRLDTMESGRLDTSLQGSHTWTQIRQIWEFSEQISVDFGSKSPHFVLKSDLKNPRICLIQGQSE